MYCVQVDSSSSATSHGTVYILLSEFLEGQHPTSKSITGSEKQQLYRHLAADIVMANFDVCGEKMTNILRVKGELVRIDLGGCLQYLPAGGLKTDFTADGVVNHIKMFLAGNDNADKMRVIVFGSFFADGDALRVELATQARSILVDYDFENYLKSFKIATLPGLDSALIVKQRLLLLAGRANIAPAPSIFKLEPLLVQTMTATAGSSTDPLPAFSRHPSVPLYPHIEESLPSQTDLLPQSDLSMRVHVVGSSTKKFRGDDPLVVNVTSGSLVVNGTSYAGGEYRQFSPRYPVGGIPMPPCYGRDDLIVGSKESKSVEGIWEGLKMLPTKNEGIESDRFLKDGGATGFTRGGKQAKSVKGSGVTHYGGNAKQLGQLGLDGSSFGYVAARKEIYLPTYKWVLDYKLQEPVQKLRLKVKGLKDTQHLYLLDANVKCSIESEDTRLSHAQLLRNYLFTGTVHEPPPVAPKQPGRPKKPPPVKNIAPRRPGVINGRLSGRPKKRRRDDR